MASTKRKYRRTNKGTRVPQGGLMDKVALVEKLSARTDLPDYGPGDTVKVHVRIKEGDKERVQIYEGTVIAIRNRGTSRSFVVRKISHGVGVERIFLESSPKVARLEIAQKGRVRRAKLYYVRELQGKSARIERDIERSQEAIAAEAKK